MLVSIEGRVTNQLVLLNALACLSQLTLIGNTS
ncbi:hypothetical protein BCF46_2938 [Litoreibacter meonggei]|uniref:Uncharacterized protein n=1 Tax=Litoreibacter meonggei TaxID=1049199 RepID=A0A497VCF4_9RHOB|nr:hypothetical protein BCF46_2938 [Litoreibacter meonggei]